jgi:hypothetical protein
MLQLDNVDDEICKEILASIGMTGDKKEMDHSKVDNKQIKFKFQYERPRTRIMTRNDTSKENKMKQGHIYKASQHYQNVCTYDFVMFLSL